MAGLQGMRPISRTSWVTRAQRAPRRAAARDASIPACPPPTITTSKDFAGAMLFAHAETGKDRGQQVLGEDPSGNLAQLRQDPRQHGGDHLRPGPRGP